MICPKCERSFYFLESYSITSPARCLKCRHRGEPISFSYESYHADLYAAKPYTRNQKTDPQMRWIFQQLAIQSGDVVIDLGCGVGDYTREIREWTEHVAGYDLDVRAAKRKFPSISFFGQDFSKAIPLPNASVDKIVSVNVIEHLADWPFFLSECARVLRPGGAIAISTANREFLLHDFHFDRTHYHEWTLPEFVKITEPYFRTLRARKDCAMFNYYPANLLLSKILKPDLTWIGRKTQ